MKRCSKCLIEKKLDLFFKSGKQKSGKDKYRGDCKACASKDTAAWRAKNREHYNSYSAEYRTKNPDKIRFIDIKRKYGLSKEDYEKMVMDHDNKCKICGSGPKGKRPLAIDHNHLTGKVRGLLCYRCNQAIFILDDKEHLAKAIEYLK